MVAGLAAAAYGVVVGLTQDEPKTDLADSSVSRVGWMLTVTIPALGTALLMRRFLFLVWTRGKTEAAHHAGGLRVPWLPAILLLILLVVLRN